MIHWSLLVMPAFFGVFVYLVNSEKESAWTWNGSYLLSYLPAVLLLVILPVSLVVFRLVLKDNMPKRNPDLSKKIRAFQTAHLVRISMIEMVALSGAVVSLVTGSQINLIVVLLALVIMALLAPTPSRLEGLLELNTEERDTIYHRETN